MARGRNHLGITVYGERDKNLSEQSLKLLTDYYCREDEKSPQEAFARAAVAYSKGDIDLAQRIYDYVSKGWFMYASPVLSNAPLEGEKVKNHFGTKHKVKINGYMGNRKLSWDRPGPTIVGRGGGTGGPVIAVHPNCERRFTVRETARIQSFPDNFEFYGSTSSQFRQIGNAVAVEFARHLGIALKKVEKIEKKRVSRS